MFKKAFLSPVGILSLSLALTVFCVSARPTFAASTFDFGANSSQNIFQKVLNSISNGFQRFYLTTIPGDKDGKVVLYQGLLSTQQQKSAELTSDITAHFLHSSVEQATLHLNINGPFRLQNSVGQAPANQDLTIMGEFSLQGTSLKTVADVKTTPDKTYFKLEQVPNLPGVDLSSITGKWYSSANATSSASSEVGESSSNLTAAQQKQLQDALKNVFESAQVGKAVPQTKNDKPVFVVLVTLPRDSVEQYLSTIVEVQSAAKKDQKPEITASLQTKLKELVDRSGDLKVTLWVDRASLNIVHAEFPISYALLKNDTAAFQKGPLAALSQVDQLNMNIVFDLDKFNQQLPFVEPTSSIDAADILSATLGKIVAPSSTSSVGTSELPTLTPEQRKQLQELNSISPEQKARFLDQISKVKLSTKSGTVKPSTPSTEPAP